MTKLVAIHKTNPNGVLPGTTVDVDLYDTITDVDAKLAAAVLGTLNNLALTGSLTLNGEALAATRARREELLRPAAALRETISRGTTSMTDTAPLTSGTRRMAALPLLKGDVVSSLTFMTGATAAVTPTHCWTELWDANRSLVMVSADQTTTAIPASTALTPSGLAKNGGGAYTAPADGLYYAALVLVAATRPSMIACTGVSNIALGQGPKLAGNSDASLTTPPSFPATAGAITNDGLGWLWAWTS